MSPLTGMPRTTYPAVELLSRLCCFAALLACAWSAFPHSSQASALIPMATAAADMALSGTTIANPKNPAGALMLNPAGLANFKGTVVTGGLGIGFGSTKINTDSGYHETNDLIAVIPDFAVSFETASGWHLGFGSYGSVGTNYDFPADAEAGVPDDFHAETSIAGFPLGIARQFGETLRVGAELIMMLGHVRNRYTAQNQLFRYTLRGPGVQGMLGATWQPSDNQSIGLAIRTPGRIWTDGSVDTGMGGRRDVDLNIRMPAQVALGLSQKLAANWEVSASSRWTDSSDFSNSIVSFSGMSEANVPFVPDAQDEWRLGIAVEWTARPGVYLRAGISDASSIVGTDGVSPLVYDNEDRRFSVGAGIERGDWVFDVMAGYSFHEGRDVPADRAAVLAGHYDSGGGAVLFGLTRQL